MKIAEQIRVREREKRENAQVRLNVRLPNSIQIEYVGSQNGLYAVKDAVVSLYERVAYKEGTMEQTITQIQITNIRAGKYQPRQVAISDASVAELAADIGEHGVRTPLLVSPNGALGVYDLISGHRRIHAARLVGLDEVPCIVLVGLSEYEKHRTALVDNIQRDDMSPIDEATALAALADLREQETGHRPSQRDLAALVGKTQGWVQQRLALIDAAPELRESLGAGEIGMGEARKLATLPAPMQAAVVAHVTDPKNKLSPTQVRNLADRVAKFSDPARFDGVESQAIMPDLRNALIGIRHLLSTLPPDTLKAAVERALAGSEDDQAILGRGTFKHATDAAPTLSLLLAAQAGTLDSWNQYRGQHGWTPELAGALERTCETCIFSGHATPKNAANAAHWMDLQCDRWAGKNVSTCDNCIVAGDFSAITIVSTMTALAAERNIEVGQFERSSYGSNSYVTSVADYATLVTAMIEQEQQRKVAAADNEKNGYRRRLEAFRQVCEDALAGDSRGLDMLDMGHAQCQWCGHCALSGGLGGECEFIHQPIRTQWGPDNRRPALCVLVKVIDDVASIAVPRCEMFRYAHKPYILETGGYTFPVARKEREKFLDALITICRAGQHGGRSDGIWSVLRWLPFGRENAKHYDPDAMTRHLLGSWDEYTDAGIAALMQIANSEARAMMRGINDRLTLLNPETGENEQWMPVDWDNFVTGKKPYDWRKNIEWPFKPRQ